MIKRVSYISISVSMGLLMAVGNNDYYHTTIFDSVLVGMGFGAIYYSVITS